MFDTDEAWIRLGRNPDEMDRADLDEFLAAAGRARSYVDAREALGLAALARLDREGSDPAGDDAERLRRTQNTSRGEARRRAERAAQLEALPATQEALEQGQITGGHADVLAAGRAKADDRAKAALAEAEPVLLAAAGSESPEDFRRRVDRFVKDHAADDGLSEWDRMKAQTELRLFRRRDGMTGISGALDPELARLVAPTLQGVAEELWRAERAGREDEPVPHAERTHPQRLAHALGVVCRRASGADARDGRRVRQRAVITMDLETLLGGLGHPTLDDGTPVPGPVARRMACEAGLIPAVLGGDSIPLDWGRARRLATETQREALALLYDTCTLFGCTAPRVWCDVHHIDPFEDGGLTNLDRLTFACGSCHDLAHRPGWRIEKHPDGAVHSWAPDGTHWEHQPKPRPTRRRPTAPRGAAPRRTAQPTLAGV
jgi:hypothetical protein